MPRIINPRGTMSPAIRKRRSRQMLEAEGGRQIAVNLSPDAAEALDTLLETDYAPNATAVVNQALVTARLRPR